VNRELTFPLSATSVVPLTPSLLFGHGQLVRSAGQELRQEALRFKFMFSGDKGIGLEQFLGVLHNLESIIPVSLARLQLTFPSLPELEPTN